MSVRTLVVAVASALLLACQPPVAPDPDAEEAEEAVSSQSGSTDAQDPGAAEAFVVSTNEPFWQARVDGDTVVLSGVEAQERRFTGARISMTADGRRLDASDAAGTLVVVTRRMRCEDDMSGARFPMTGLLTIDGQGPFHGCARPASIPAPTPPDEGAGDLRDREVPERFVGRWDVDTEACEAPGGEGGLRIAADRLDFHESTATVLSSTAVDAGAQRLELRIQGEGDTWEAARILWLDAAGALVIEDADGGRMDRVRCTG